MNCDKKQKQKGGGTDYSQLYHSVTMGDVQAQSRFTEKYIDRAPMFNVLDHNAIFPTGTTGIVPTGAFYLECSRGPEKLKHDQVGQMGRGMKCQKF